MASYTLSKTIDDASDFDEQPQNPFDLGAERAFSSQYQQQRFTLSCAGELAGRARQRRERSGRTIAEPNAVDLLAMDARVVWDRLGTRGSLAQSMILEPQTPLFGLDFVYARSQTRTVSALSASQIKESSWAVGCPGGSP